MWRAMFLNRLDVLHRINENLTAEKYDHMMDFVLIPYGLLGPFPGGLYLFQRDLSPMHTAKRIKQHLRQRSVLLLEWPAQSADLTIIAHVWADLKQLCKVSPNSASPDALWNAVETEWKTLEADKAFVGVLYSSMPSRIEAVITAEGGVTRH
ncbi:hypothetical protein HPB50_028019 [Hyalomma asiaticum]|nr:hypothetical protein HPB50_028019 [Hyalomma asiaticum]